MTPKFRIFAVLLVSSSLFITFTGVSWLVQSDGFEVQDGITRVGFPIPFYEEGGLFHEYSFRTAVFVADIMMSVGLGSAIVTVALLRRNRNNSANR